MEICEHMEVVDANDQHVGIVEKVEGDRITLIMPSILNIRSLTKAKSPASKAIRSSCHKKYPRLQRELSSLRTVDERLNVSIASLGDLAN
jgi:hypothetical protein